MKLRWNMPGSPLVQSAPAIMMVPLEDRVVSVRDFMKSWMDFLQPPEPKNPEKLESWLAPNMEPVRQHNSGVWDLSFLSNIEVMSRYGGIITEVRISMTDNPPIPNLSFDVFAIAKRYADNKKSK